jgi:hypothetical protein
MQVVSPPAHTFFPRGSKSRFAPEEKLGLRPMPEVGGLWAAELGAHLKAFGERV